jgi:hypothetical protein
VVTPGIPGETSGNFFDFGLCQLRAATQAAHASYPLEGLWSVIDLLGNGS